MLFRSIFSSATAVDARIEGTPVTPLGLTLGGHVQLEVEYDNWSATKPDQLRFWKARVGQMDAGTYKRWRKKLENIHREDWPRSIKIQLGTTLIKEAVKNSAGWLETRMVPHKGRTEYRLFVSSEARDAILDIHERMEIKRPYLLPMLVPPKPWAEAV